jgi:hypothetical protein
MQRTIYIRDEPAVEAHPEERHILIRREGEPDSVRVYLNEVRYLADALYTMAAEMVGYLSGDKDVGGESQHRWLA